MPSYKITYLGKTAIFTEKDLRMLKERFARATGESHLFRDLVIRGKPCICWNYNIDCDSKCPFSVFGKYGCDSIIHRLDPKGVVVFRLRNLTWHKTNQTEVNNVFRRVRKFLARAVRIPDGDSNA